MSRFYYLTYDVLSGVVPFVQFRKREKHASRSISLLKVTLPFRCVLRFLNCAHGTKSRKASYTSMQFFKETLLVESVVLHNSSNPT